MFALFARWPTRLETFIGDGRMNEWIVVLILFWVGKSGLCNQLFHLIKAPFRLWMTVGSGFSIEMAAYPSPKQMTWSSSFVACISIYFLLASDGTAVG